MWCARRVARLDGGEPASRPDRLAVGVDINATHTRSATSGIVTGVCTPVHLGWSLTVHEIAVTDDQGRRCSTIRITNMIKDRPAGA